MAAGLSVRGAHDIITGIAADAGLDDDVTAHPLRHFATTLVRGGSSDTPGWRPPGPTLARRPKSG
ncbi:MAG: hypothetical protein ACRDJU_07575 [Actinomycetota bacterium]